MRIIIGFVTNAVEKYKIGEISDEVGDTIIPVGYTLVRIEYHRDGLSSINNSDTSNPNYLCVYQRADNEKDRVFKVVKAAVVDEVIFVDRKKEDLETEDVEPARAGGE